ncbi:MAG: DUF3375 family protein [Rubrivivax sp.]|nr:DUF3375 family protein [Rubrivivax sp.]
MSATTHAAVRHAASLRALREQPLWQLLAATKAPAILAVLRAVFAEGDLAVPGSMLHERVARELEPRPFACYMRTR